MVPIQRCAALAALVISLVALPASGAWAAQYNRLSLSNEAIDGFDVVAYWLTGEPTPGSRAYSYEWKDAVWLFSTPNDLAKFKAAPERYVPAFGGYDAYAMSQGIKADIHPFIFTIQDDKLYLFYTFKAREKFLADPNLEQAAQEHWTSISQRVF